MDALHKWVFDRVHGRGPVRVGRYSFELDHRSAMKKRLALYGWRAAPEIELAVSLLREGDVAVDVGAHVGVFAVPASDAVGQAGRVVSFEPNPMVLPLLRRNLTANGCENVELERYAVSDGPGTARLAQHDSSLGFTSLRSFEGVSRTFDVETVRLDDFLAERSLAPSLIKIDVEGAEGLVLEGAAGTLERNPACIVVLELHPTAKAFGHAPADVLDLLERVGHRVYRVVGRGRLAPLSPDRALQWQGVEGRVHLLSCARPDRLPCELLDEPAP